MRRADPIAAELGRLYLAIYWEPVCQPYCTRFDTLAVLPYLFSVPLRRSHGLRVRSLLLGICAKSEQDDKKAAELPHGEIWKYDLHMRCAIVCHLPFIP